MGSMWLQNCATGKDYYFVDHANRSTECMLEEEEYHGDDDVAMQSFIEQDFGIAKGRWRMARVIHSIRGNGIRGSLPQVTLWICLDKKNNITDVIDMFRRTPSSTEIDSSTSR